MNFVFNSPLKCQSLYMGIMCLRTKTKLYIWQFDKLPWHGETSDVDCCLWRPWKEPARGLLKEYWCLKQGPWQNFQFRPGAMGYAHPQPSMRSCTGGVRLSCFWKQLTTQLDTPCCTLQAGLMNTPSCKCCEFDGPAEVRAPLEPKSNCHAAESSSTTLAAELPRLLTELAIGHHQQWHREKQDHGASKAPYWVCHWQQLWDCHEELLDRKGETQSLCDCLANSGPWWHACRYHLTFHQQTGQGSCSTGVPSGHSLPHRPQKRASERIQCWSNHHKVHECPLCSGHCHHGC